MLQRAVARWHRRRREAELTFRLPHRDDVVIVPPSVFSPTWDRMHAKRLKRRCERLESAAAAGGAGSDVDATARAICTRLRHEWYQPNLPSDRNAFTHHWWAHTYLPGADSDQAIPP